jgi:PleD family two-component response regulator
LTPTVDRPLVLARRAQSLTLEEFKRVLRVFACLQRPAGSPKNQPKTECDSERDKSISVVDDDESVRDSTMALLRLMGHKVATFESGQLFLESGTLTDTECLILDMQMPGIDGLALKC